MDTPTLIAVLVLLIGALLTHWLARTREHRAVRRAAAVEFHKAFADTLLNLENSEVGTARIVREFDLKHKAAIATFRPYIQFRKRESFERKVRQLDEISAEYRNVGPLGMLSTELGGVARANREALTYAVRELLSFAALI